MNCNKEKCCGLSVIFEPQKLNAEIANPIINVEIANPIIKEYINVGPYMGNYTVTPTEETQVLPTCTKQMIKDLIVEPIPLNYGRITWNGRIITIQ